MKQELRCHAVLCPSEKKARLMATRLQERLHQALVDFRKEKMSRQNARLSLANSIYENPTMPCRKILLHTGSSNYRPSPDRAKSAPKLKVRACCVMGNCVSYKAITVLAAACNLCKPCSSVQRCSFGSFSLRKGGQAHSVPQKIGKIAIRDGSSSKVAKEMFLLILSVQKYVSATLKPFRASR